MDRIDNLIVEIKSIQNELDRRTELENEAMRLISECRFEEAIRLLSTI